mgnify:CR=1 FL=1
MLQQEVEKRTREIQAIQDVTILAMASLAETRDNETGNHIRRTQNYVRALARQLQKSPKYAAYLTEQMIEMLFKSAPLHDIGKVGIPDSALMPAVCHNRVDRPSRLNSSPPAAEPRGGGSATFEFVEVHDLEPVAGARIVGLTLGSAEGGAQRQTADAAHAIDTHFHRLPLM